MGGRPIVSTKALPASNNELEGGLPNDKRKLLRLWRDKNRSGRAGESLPGRRLK